VREKAFSRRTFSADNSGGAYSRRCTSGYLLDAPSARTKEISSFEKVLQRKNLRLLSAIASFFFFRKFAIVSVNK